MFSNQLDKLIKAKKEFDTIIEIYESTKFDDSNFEKHRMLFRLARTKYQKVMLKYAKKNKIKITPISDSIKIEWQQQ